MFELPETAILYASDRHGIYIPQYFAESVNPECLSGVSGEDLAILLAGPDHEFYLDVWNDVCSDAVLTDSNGITYYLWQDGDLWLVPTDHEWED